MDIIFSIFEYIHITSFARVLGIIVLAVIVIDVFYILFMLLRNQYITHSSVKYTSPQIKGVTSRKILILGDSTAVGIGATHPEESIAGRLAKDFPDSCIINMSDNGARTVDILTQLDNAPKHDYDMVIISTGGNDILNFWSLKELSTSLDQVLIRAKKISNHRVILLLYSIVGSAPLFSLLLHIPLGFRAKKVQKIFRSIAKKCEVPCIELFTETEGNVFVSKSKTLFSLDKIHPSSEGYKVWYYRMWKEMYKGGFTY